MEFLVQISLLRRTNCSEGNFIILYFFEDWQLVSRYVFVLISGSFYLLGALPGSLLSEALSSKFGRRNTILYSSVFIIAAWILVAAAVNIYMILAGRLLLGLFICATVPASALYVTEISHQSIRGTLMTFIQMSATVGMVVSYLLGLGTNWWQLAAVCGCTPLLMLITLPFVPKSPVWLLQKGLAEDAMISMTKIRGSSYDVKKELDEMHEQIKNKPTTGNFKLY